MPRAQPRIVIYTDGGCRGNPGVGGWGFLLIDTETEKALERRGGEAHTTNNRMEMTAAIEALRALKDGRLKIEIRSDSRYLVDMCTSWMKGWKARGWKRKGGQILNLDLVQELDRLLQEFDVRFVWVQGHAGDPGNEYADKLTNEAMDRLLARSDPAAEKRHTTSPIEL